MDRSLGRSTRLTALVTVALTAAACGPTTKIDKAGAVQRHTTVIRLEMPEAGDVDGSYFVKDATARSRGTLTIVPDVDSYDSGLPQSEARLVSAMRAGKVGFSYEPAHDWAAAGVASLEALDAPFLVTTVSASERLARSPIAGAVLDGLSTVGMVGIGLIPNEPRGVLSLQPLFSPEAFDGLRLHIVDSPQTADLVTALGAVPVQGLSAGQSVLVLKSGSVDALETSPTYILSNSFNAEAPYLTSYALISRFDIIVATKAAWAGLTSQQQVALRQAASDTVAHSVQVPVTEHNELTELCQAGLVIDEPTSSQLAALVAESRAAMPVGTAAAAMIRRIATSIPGAGAQMTDTPPPASCHVAHTTTQAENFHKGVTAPASQVAGTSAIPAGVYVATDSVADFRTGGVTGGDWNKPVTWTTHLFANGTVVETQKPTYPDQPINRGVYRVSGNEVTFFWDPASDLTPESLHWSYFDGQLTFTIVDVQDQAGQVEYTAHPWRKIR
jgi:TRAP-type C4-dicarboxylate transport system substrate-binding protein